MPLTTISQFIGSAYIHTGASHTRSTPTIGPFNNAGGSTPHIEYNPGPGTFSTASVDTPRIGVNNLPAGVYRVTMSVTGSAGSSNASLTINDGITSSGYCGFDGASNRKNILIGYFTYAAVSTNVVYELWAANDGNTTTVYADGAPGIGVATAWDLHISIEKVA